MTLVTTSRRSTPVIRSIAKDLAFASGSSYLTRGKHGIREIAGEHEFFIVIEQQKSDVLLTIYDDGTPCMSRIIKEHQPGIREGEIFRGLKTSDKKLGLVLEKFCQVMYVDEEGLFLSFDGPQRRCKKLVLSGDDA
ncbi:hypothetical protein ACKUB1_05150 [Methanospirillum stamsii]|mgnify:CR=1 FL=1|uniref:Uncharacterized protein n=1 Tax=Methanospirillum stamsii TaxID=1277351 RepID=A0A2V2N128_9EURY|nr:hypothetical protein [Methanospirillum stamsii]PWR73459.1 hypothetical protein DLD82_09415 [Methanospirillum stamsii]